MGWSDADGCFFHTLSSKSDFDSSPPSVIEERRRTEYNLVPCRSRATLVRASASASRKWVGVSTVRMPWMHHGCAENVVLIMWRCTRAVVWCAVMVCDPTPLFSGSILGRGAYTACHTCLAQAPPGAHGRSCVAKRAHASG